MTDNGLTITLTRAGGVGFDIVDNSLPGQDKAPGFGNRSLNPFFSIQDGDFWIANFSQPISSFSIQFGDYGPSDDDSPATLSGYAGANGSGLLLATDSADWEGADSLPDFGSVSVVAAGINSVVFTSSPDGFNPNSLFWDNISVRFDEGTSVPEAASTAMLLGLSSVGLFGFRRRA